MTPPTSSLKARLLTGLAVLVPLGITIIVLRFLYGITASFLAPLLAFAFDDVLPAWLLSLISVILLLVLVYLTGTLATNVAGKQLIALGEAIVNRIPLVKSIYAAARQVVDAIASTDKQAFKGVAFVPAPPGCQSLGFISGEAEDRNGLLCYKIFIPTAPNPTTGFFLLVPQDRVTVSDLTVEQAIKLIVSGGVVGPQRFQCAFDDYQSDS